MRRRVGKCDRFLMKGIAAMSAKTIVIADDLTGANATGVLMRKQGLSAFVCLYTDGKTTEDMNELNLDMQSNFDTVIYTTDSRNIEKSEAYSRVKTVCKSFKATENIHFSKRIDSTLRGNIKAELDAMCEIFTEHCILVMPAFPGAGRYCINGLLYLGEKLLEDTEVTKDPLFPVNSSEVCEILNIDKTSHISIAIVESGKEAVCKELRQLYQEGKRIIVIDAQTNEHLQTAAAAAVQSNIPFITSDPGPFTSYTSGMIQNRNRMHSGLEMQVNQRKSFVSDEKRKILLSIGTSVQITKTQIDLLCRKYQVGKAEMILENLLESPEKEIVRLQDILIKSDESILLLHTDSLRKGVRIEAGDRNEELSELIKKAFADLTVQVWEKDSAIDTIICSGGDITSAICKKAGASGIEIIEEIAPLISFGRISEENRYPGRKLYMITKGGLAGDTDAFVRCIQFLQSR